GAQHRSRHASLLFRPCLAGAAPGAASGVLRRRRGARPDRNVRHPSRAGPRNRAASAHRDCGQGSDRARRLPTPAGGRLMEFEYWWLAALPIFFGLGWLAARVDIKHLVKDSRALPTSYFKGLNSLLNEQPDKAIEAFIEVVKVDPETVELHFALGSLFRRRGEYDRAIRMHQHLLEPAHLGAEQNTTAPREAR